ncbi:hypothetical protein GQR58_008120 [Nymphon striatum]|nr:hypothetical protein GQR58_008120 [Nymphon striatum]
MYSGASFARALQRGNPALDFEGLAERMARAYRGHHSLAGRLPAIEGQGGSGSSKLGRLEQTSRDWMPHNNDNGGIYKSTSDTVQGKMLTSSNDVSIKNYPEPYCSVAEDASWLRKESDHRHINVAELEAVARGINLAISWGFKTFTVATDSRTVISWMDNTVEGHRRVRTKGASEMLIKRRLGVIRDTITEFGLTVTVRFVSTTENKADRMTRVPKKWIGHRDTGEEGADVSAALATGESVEDAIWAAHLPHHLGVDRTLYLARQIRSNLTREQVKRELVGCEACQRIDPARREENLVAQGSLAVDGNWRRVAVDVTHYGAKHYLSMVDCGPSRFAIWSSVK